MSDVIEDPFIPGVYLIGEAALGAYGQQSGATVLHNVHHPAKCEGRPCVIHKPSDHHMRSFPLNWRDDKGVMERQCPHEVWHPDPDDMAYQLSEGRGFLVMHTCDGCCRRRLRTVAQ